MKVEKSKTCSTSGHVTILDKTVDTEEVHSTLLSPNLIYFCYESDFCPISQSLAFILYHPHPLSFDPHHPPEGFVNRFFIPSILGGSSIQILPGHLLLYGGGWWWNGRKCSDCDSPDIKQNI